MNSPKPGDPDFVPRYPPLDDILAKMKARIEERDATARSLERRAGARAMDAFGSSLANQAEAIRSDTEMMRELLVIIESQRIAINVLKGG